MLIPKKNEKDFPRGPVVKNLPYNTEDTGSICGQGTKIPHAPEQLSLHAQLEFPLPQWRIPQDVMKILCTATKTQHRQINNFWKGMKNIC